MGTKGHVITCDTYHVWNKIIEETRDTKMKSMVVSCMASWAGPCKFMDVYFEELSQQFQDILFVKVDVSILKGVMQDVEIDGYPTFLMLQNGKEVSRVLGASKNELWQMISMYSSK